VRRRDCHWELDETRQEVLDATLPDLVAARSAIDRAKGVLMVM